MEIETEKTNNASGDRELEKPLVFADDETELAEDGFYEKLTKLNESSGHNYVMKPCLHPQKIGATKGKHGSDLHLLYKEVTKRGGFYQVMKDEKWDEVESALNLRSSESMLPARLQKVYQIHLLPFEQAYWKAANKSNVCSDTTFPGPSSVEVAQSSTTEKRKQSERSSPLLDSVTLNSPEEESKINVDTCNVDEVRKKKRLHSIVREVKDENDAPPLNPRTGHHIFLRLECHRLKMIHGENSGDQKIRNMVLNAWNSLSDEGKQPYLDASKIDKERYAREMEEYNKRGGICEKE